MTASLDNPFAKLRRAGEHLNTLHEATQAYIDGEPYDITVAREPESDWDVFYIRVREQPPLRLGAILGDYLQNLRSALDNLVTQLILLNGKPLPRRTGFPVFDTERSYKAVGVKRISGVRPQHAAVIESLQPYHGGNDTRPRSIELVNALANLDRHKTIHPAFVGPARRDVPFVFRREPINTNVLIEGEVTSAGKGLEDGAELARLRVLTPQGQAQIEVKANVLVELAFGERGLRLYALPTIGIEVGKVVNSFAPDFPAPVAAA